MKAATASTPGKTEAASTKGSTDKQPASPAMVNPLWMNLAMLGDGSVPAIQRKCDACTEDRQPKSGHDTAWTKLATRVPSVQRKCSACEDEAEKRPGVQFALHVNRPEDPFEREADAIADAVVNRTATPSMTRTGAASPTAAQAWSDTADSRSLPMALERRDFGEPVPREVRDRVEPVLGADLGHVRVRRGSEADEATRSVGARAFTHRSDIYLRSNERPTDLRLMAHELTHTVQQGATRSPAIRAGVVSDSVQRLCDSEVRGEGVVPTEQPTPPSAEERGRRHASRVPPGAQRQDIIEQTRERERARNQPDQIGPAPLSGVIVRAPDWPVVDHTEVPLVEWNESTGNVPFAVIPIPELATTITIGGEAHARAEVRAGYGAGRLQNVRLGLTPRQAAMFEVGSLFGLGPNSNAAWLLPYFGDFRGQAELYVPADFSAEFRLGASLEALAELLGIIDIASIRGGIEAVARASANLAFRGQLYFDCIGGEFSFAYSQTLPLQVNLGFDLDAVVGGSFGIWPLDYTWEKRWNLFCWYWMRQWQLGPRLTIDYNARAGASRAGGFDASQAFVIDLEGVPVGDLTELVESLLGNDEPGDLQSRRREDAPEQEEPSDLPSGGQQREPRAARDRDRRSGGRERRERNRDRRQPRNLDPTPEELEEHRPPTEDPDAPRTCASDFPGMQTCSSLSDRLYSSVDAALTGVRAVYPDAVIGNVRRVTGNDCQHPLPNGHIGVYTNAQQDEYAGTIFGCSCCDDGEGTREPRWRDIYTTNVSAAARER